METLIQDVRYALRLCLRTPGFTFVAVMALALGIGVNVAIFTVVDAVLIAPLPFRDPGRLVVLWESNARRPGVPSVVGPANFVRWRERTTSFDQLAGFADFRANLTGQGDPEEVAVLAAEPNLFPMLGLSPMFGRGFTRTDATATAVAGTAVPATGPAAVALISRDLWERRFGGDPAVVGRTVELSDVPTTIVGVMPDDAQFLIRAGSLVGRPPDLWIPLQFTNAAREPRGRYISVLGRLRPDVTVARAQSEMSAIAANLAAELPQFDNGWNVRVVPLHDQLSGDLRQALLVLAGAAFFVLLIACANVANLLLARSAARQGEIAIRTALGAARRRVARQLLTESLVLAVLGGGVGLLLAGWGLRVLLALSPAGLIDPASVHLSRPALAMAAALAALTTIVCGLAPVFEAARVEVQETLKDVARQVGAGPKARRLRQAFVVAEIALAAVLLVGAGLLLRSFAALRSIDPGFTAGHVLTARTSLPPARYADPAEVRRFYEEATARIAAVPGVASAGAINFLPLAGLGAATSFTIVGQPEPPPGQAPTTDVRVCDDGYFDAMQVRLLRGRLFDDRELHDNAHVVVINQTLADRYFPGADPLGQRLDVAMGAAAGAAGPTEIVGVVADVKAYTLTGGARPMVYWPPPQLTYNAMTFTIRTDGDPLSLAPSVARVVQGLDKDQPLSEVRTMDQWVARSQSETRFTSTLLGTFAGLALFLAAIGIYGLISYSVIQRRPEIGIRLALGAQPRDIVRLVVGQGLRLAAIGLAVGLLLVLVLGRVIASALIGTRADDPLTLAAVFAILAAVAAAASYVPARRATRVDPLGALRSS